MAKDNNREKAMSALINASSVAQASEQSGLSERTLYRFLEDEGFKNEYKQARRQMFEQTVGQIQAACGAAIETLKRNLTCNNPQAEISAARTILDNAHKAIEILDLQERMEVFENELKKQNRQT